MRCNHLQAATACFVALLLASVAPLAADESKQVFDSLFAAKIKAVSATSSRADDVALAGELLAVAKTSTEQTGLLALLCDAAYDLGFRTAEGYPAAIEAQQLLAEYGKEKREGAQEKLITLLTRQSATGKADEREAASESLIALLLSMGDEKFEKKQYLEAAGDYRRAVSVATQRKSASLEEAKAKLEFAAARDRAVKNLARLQEKLLKDANDSATAEEIVKIYLIELDDPAGAAPYLNRVKDEQLKRLVPLAAVSVTELGEADALQLGEWYWTTTRAEKSPQVTGPLRRAQACFARYLELHAASDLYRTKAEAMAKEVDSAIAMSPPLFLPLSDDPIHAKLLESAVLLVTFEKGTVVATAPDMHVRDISRRRAAGKVVGGVLTERASGAALQLKGDKAVIQFDGKLKFPSGFTIASWVRIDDLSNKYPTILASEDNQIHIGISGSGHPAEQAGEVTFYLANKAGRNTLRSRGKLKLGQWTFVAATYNGKMLSITLNGSKADTLGLGTPPELPEMAFQRFGNYRLSQDDVLYGAIDEICIFPRALSADEIQLIYERGK